LTFRETYEDMAWGRSVFSIDDRKMVAAMSDDDDAVDATRNLARGVREITLHFRHLCVVGTSPQEFESAPVTEGASDERLDDGVR
jgi:hypothetical protein